jgi:uncharacterized protein
VKFTLESDANVNLITAYGAGEIRVRERILRGNLIITPAEIIEDWPVASIDTLDMTALEPALALAPDLIILGTGQQLRFPPRGLRGQMQARSIGFEVMDTPAACRTYNVLVLEGRKVVASLPA